MPFDLLPSAAHHAAKQKLNQFLMKKFFLIFLDSCLKYLITCFTTFVFFFSHIKVVISTYKIFTGQVVVVTPNKESSAFGELNGSPVLFKLSSSNPG